jgi:hypothetical protein
MTDETTSGENSQPRPRNAPWRKGESGNPSGKPKGTRHKVTMAIEALLDGEAEGLTRKAIDLALAGDLTALRICLDRLAPPRRDRPVTFELPEVNNAADAARAARAVLEAVAGGEVTPSEAGDIGKLIDAYVRVLEVTEFEERLSRLGLCRLVAGARNLRRIPQIFRRVASTASDGRDHSG